MAQDWWWGVAASARPCCRSWAESPRGCSLWEPHARTGDCLGIPCGERSSFYRWISPTTPASRCWQQALKITPLRLVINTAGLLHGPLLQPEKRLSQVNRQALELSFAVNAFAPLLLAQAIESLFSPTDPFHFASLSARVGSIGDNQLGGWYAYRAAKAAQNQMLRTLALEWARRKPKGCVSLLHPGTTATGLSAPFQAGVPPDRLFSPERAAQQLLDVLAVLEPQQTGQFWAWDGQQIAW